MKKTIQVLKIIFMVLAILTMCCTLAKKASADPISSYEIQYLEDMMQSWDSFPNNTPVDFTSLYAQFESDCINYPYYVTNNSNYILMCKKPSFGLVSVYDSSYNPKDVAFNVSEYPNWQDSFPFIVYQSYVPASDWRVVIRFEVSDFSGGMTVSPMRFSWTGNVSSSKTDYTRITYYNSNSFSVSNTSWYGNVDSFYRCNGSQGTGYSTGWSISQLSVTPIQIPYTEDSRLKFSTFTLPSGGKYLQTDIRKIVKEFPIPDTAHSSVYLYPDEEITLTLTFIDENDVETTEQFLLDADNSVISSKYIFSTEFDVFGDFSDYKDVYISACDFSLFGSEQGGSSEQEDYHISCQYYLKQYVSPIMPAEIEEPVYDDPEVVPQSEIAETIQMLNESSSSAPNAFSGDWVYEQDHPVPPSWADHYDFRVIYSDDNSFVGNLVNSNVWNYYTDNDPNGLDWLTSSFMPRKFVFENSAFAFYDMIIISVYSANVALSPDNLNILVYNNIELQGYIVFYSERFYVHQQAITQQSILSSLEYIGYNANLYYDYMYDQLQDFELKNLLALGSLIDYAKKENNLLSTIDLDINNNTSDIITAIKNNKFVPDYSSLIAEMELIKSAVLSVPVSVRSDLVYLFMPTYDGISVNFQQYHDDIGILALPFDETKLVYDTMKNNYTGNFEIDVPELKVQGFTLYEGSHFSFNVWSLFDNNKLSSSDGTGLGFVKGLRYFIAFVAIYGSVASTYAHIFRRENTQD